MYDHHISEARKHLKHEWEHRNASLESEKAHELNHPHTLEHEAEKQHHMDEASRIHQHLTHMKNEEEGSTDKQIRDEKIRVKNVLDDHSNYIENYNKEVARKKAQHAANNAYAQRNGYKGIGYSGPEEKHNWAKAAASDSNYIHHIANNNHKVRIRQEAEKSVDHDVHSGWKKSDKIENHDPKDNVHDHTHALNPGQLSKQQLDKHIDYHDKKMKETAKKLGTLEGRMELAPDEIPKSVYDLRDHLKRKVLEHVNHKIRLQGHKEIVHDRNYRDVIPNYVNQDEVDEYMKERESKIPANDHDMYVGTPQSHIDKYTGKPAQEIPTEAESEASRIATKERWEKSQEKLRQEREAKYPDGAPPPANDNDSAPPPKPANDYTPANESVNYINESYENETHKYPTIAIDYHKGNSVRHHISKAGVDLQADEVLEKKLNEKNTPQTASHENGQHSVWRVRQREPEVLTMYHEDALGKEHSVDLNAHNLLSSEVHNIASLQRGIAHDKAKRDTEKAKRKGMFGFLKKPYVVQTDDLHESKKVFKYGESAEYRKIALFSDIVNEMEVRDMSGKVKKVQNVAIRMADGTIRDLPPGKSGSSGGGGK